jgi:hypothetical protein
VRLLPIKSLDLTIDGLDRSAHFVVAFEHDAFAVLILHFTDSPETSLDQLVSEMVKL